MGSIHDIDDQRKKALASQQSPNADDHLNGRGGGGTSGGMSDDWKKSVDEQLKQLHDDFRKIIGWLIAAVAGPFIAIFGLYVYIGIQASALEGRIVSVEKTIASVQVEQAKTNGKIDLLIERTTTKK